MDKLRKYLAYNGTVSISVIESTELVEEARKIHDLTPTTTAVLGRVLTATALLGSELKEKEDSITVQIKGGGPVGGIVAVGESNVHVRGYVQNPHIELPLNSEGKIDVGGAVGTNGYLNIIKDIGMKEPYIGIVPLVSGEIAEDFARYFAESEQKNSAIALGVLVDKDGVKRAGGYEISLMPDVTDDIVTILEENVKNTPSISKLLSENKDLDEIAKQISGDENIQCIEKNTTPKFECNCSFERFEKGLVSLGKNELEIMIKNEEEVETVCHFCNKKYIFDKNKLKEILSNM